jgi:hypothetical protein
VPSDGVVNAALTALTTDPVPMHPENDGNADDPLLCKTSPEVPVLATQFSGPVVDVPAHSTPYGMAKFVLPVPPQDTPRTSKFHLLVPSDMSIGDAPAVFKTMLVLPFIVSLPDRLSVAVFVAPNVFAMSENDTRAPAG